NPMPQMMNGKLHYFFHEAEPTQRTIDYHAKKLDEFRRKHPQVWGCPQPDPLPKVSGRFGLDMRKEFELIAEQVEAGTFQLRDPLSSVAGAGLRFFACVGWCLDPAIRHQDGCWVDSRMVAQHGDFV